MKFHASAVSCDLREDALVVSLADRADDPRQYVILSRTLQADDQDTRLGHDGIHCELGSQAQSGYDWIREIRLGLDNVVVVLRKQVAVNFCLDETIEIVLSHACGSLADSLRQLVRGTNCRLATDPAHDQACGT